MTPVASAMLCSPICKARTLASIALKVDDLNRLSAVRTHRLRRRPSPRATPRNRRRQPTKWSRLALPAALRVHLPVGDLETFGLAIGPTRPCGRHRLRIFAIEDRNDPHIACRIGRHRYAINQEPHLRGVAIVATEREQHWLERGIA